MPRSPSGILKRSSFSRGASSSLLLTRSSRRLLILSRPSCSGQTRPTSDLTEGQSYARLAKLGNLYQQFMSDDERRSIVSAGGDFDRVTTEVRSSFLVTCCVSASSCVVRRGEGGCGAREDASTPLLPAELCARLDGERPLLYRALQGVRSSLSTSVAARSSC